MTYSVNRQIAICKNKGNCFFGKSPSLADLNRDFDEEAASMWLIPQLTNLAMYSNSQKVMNDNLVEECASIIASEYYYLKLTELMLFFHNFKAGKYGQFYGSVSPLVITTALRQFLRERENAIVSHEAEEAQKQSEKSLDLIGGHVDYSAYIRQREKELTEAKKFK